jgi:2-dehydro-3-deoxygluconokinase
MSSDLERRHGRRKAAKSIDGFALSNRGCLTHLLRPMSEVVTFGEIMLRLTPPGNLRLTQTAHFEITFGGAEANVAVMIAQLGGGADYVTKLPANDIAQRAVNELRGLGVGVAGIVRGGERIGVYFLEQGASQRAGKIIYDRADSAIALAQPGDFDWERIFAGARWFHWSGITPALSLSAAEITAQAAAVARRMGLTVSFDLNYRAKLWSREQAGETLAPLMNAVDLCVTSVEEARTVFGLQIDETAPDREEQAARLLIGKFGFKMVALTQRQGAMACETSWGAMLFAGNRAHFSRRHEISIVDRVGAGDSFSGALIFSLRRGDAPQRAVDFAVAASCLKHTVPGDYNFVSLDEVEALAAGAGGGRVQR